MSGSDGRFSMVSVVNEFAISSRVDIHQEAEFELLSDLVKSFAPNPVLARRAMREMLARMPGKFYAGALQLLKSGEPSPGHDYLISLLLENDLLIFALADPAAFNLQTAITLAKHLYRLDPHLDAKLLTHIMRDVGGGPSAAAANLESLERILEIIDAVSDAKRLVPILMKLQRHGDPRIRSKAVLLLVRSHRNVDWLQHQLSNADPRMRANAIEGLLDTTPSSKEIQILWAAAADSNHRVATTAMLVLLKNGQKEAAEQLLQTCQHPSELFRAGAAWAMGKTDNPDFLESLQKMARADTGMAKRMALKSSVSLRKNIQSNLKPPDASPAAAVTSDPAKDATVEKSSTSDIDPPGAVQSG